MTFHKNWIGLFEVMPRYLETAKFWRDNGIVMGVTRMPMSSFNAAIIEDPSVLSPARLQKISSTFYDLAVPYSVQIFSDSTPPKVDTFFRDHGYARMFCDPLMVCDGKLAPFELNSVVEVQQVIDEEDQANYSYVVIEGFDLLPNAQDFVDIMLKMDESYHVVARIAGESVGAGSVIFCNGVAGIYNVATLRHARRQGVAKAIMRALHDYALATGYDGTALASSTMGYPLYQRLGYRLDGYQAAYAPMDMP